MAKFGYDGKEAGDIIMMGDKEYEILEVYRLIDINRLIKQIREIQSCEVLHNI